jgi:hypothetical protein
VVPAGLVLFPGALLEHRAYGVIATQLAAQGIVVVLVPSCEPCRLPTALLGANAESTVPTIRQRLTIRSVTTIRQRVGSLNTDSLQTTDSKRYYS